MEGRTRGQRALRQEGVKEPREERGRRGWSPCTSSPSQALLAASEDVTYNGVVSMRKEAFLPLDGLQWELKLYEKSQFRLVPVGARSGSYGRESSVHLDLAEKSTHSIVLWSEHWYGDSCPPSSPSVGPPLHGSHMRFSFLFSVFLFFFLFLSFLFFCFLCPLRISLCRMPGFVKLPPSKFLQLCIVRLWYLWISCKWATNRYFIYIRSHESESPRKTVNMQEEAEGLSFWLLLTSPLPLKPIMRHTADI